MGQCAMGINQTQVSESKQHVKIGNHCVTAICLSVEIKKDQMPLWCRCED